MKVVTKGLNDDLTLLLFGELASILAIQRDPGETARSFADRFRVQLNMRLANARFIEDKLSALAVSDPISREKYVILTERLKTVNCEIMIKALAILERAAWEPHNN